MDGEENGRTEEEEEGEDRGEDEGDAAGKLFVVAGMMNLLAENGDALSAAADSVVACIAA